MLKFYTFVGTSRLLHLLQKPTETSVHGGKTMRVSSQNKRTSFPYNFCFDAIEKFTNYSMAEQKLQINKVFNDLEVNFSLINRIKIDPVSGEIINSGLKINSLSNNISLSWDQAERIDCNLEFSWRGIKLKIVANIYSGPRSRTQTFSLIHKNKPYRFGIGMSSVGAGYIGECPKIATSSHQLDFQFGQNFMSIKEVVLRV